MIKEFVTKVDDFDDCRRVFEKIRGILRTGGTVNEIQKEGVRVGDPDIRILDFDKHFTLTELPDRDIDISLRKASVSLTGVASFDPSDFEVAALTAEVSLKDVAQRVFVATTDDTIANTTSQTAFSPAGVGSATLAVYSLSVGDVLRIRASGNISTV